MSKTVGIYAGSFDPVTNGHLDIIRRASNLFDKVIIAVGINANKKYTFSTEDRIKMIKDLVGLNPKSGSLDHLIYRPVSNASVISMDNDLLVHFAKSVNATHIVRGIRSHKDFDDESLMQRINKDIDPSVETVFFIPNKEFIDVSSSLVKALVGPKYWHYIIVKYVPGNVLEQLAKKEFKKICTELGLNESGTEQVWKKYVVHPRYYHNPLHILDVFSDLNTYSGLFLDDLNAAKYALLFHDVEDTEAKSFEFFNAANYITFINKAMTYGEKAFINKVKSLIMATDHSRTDFDTFSNSEKLVHDLDLMILASDQIIYDQYAADVEKEYTSKGKISKKEYYEGREKVLQMFLKREEGSLFLHEAFKELEEKARNNMTKESIMKWSELREERELQKGK